MANSSEDLYEFNAPQHYFDFKERLNEEPDDSYFDCREGGSLNLETPKVEAGTPRPLRSASRHNSGISRSVIPKKPKDSIGTPKRPSVAAASPKRAPLPLTMEVDAVKESEDKENMSRTIMSSPGVTEKKEIPAVHKKAKSFSPAVRSSPRLSAIAKALRRTNAARRSGGFGSRRSSSGGSSGTQFSGVNKQKTQNKPSVPKVQGMKGLSEQDCSELQMIATFKQKMANNKKKPLQSSGPCVVPTVPHEFNFATDTRLRQKNPVEPSHSPRAAPARKTRHGSTVPQEFHFATDARVQKHSSAEEQEAVTFPQFLRSGSSVTDKELSKGPTIPQPFNLTESRKAATGIETNKFVSVAELNLKFHTRTPQRFRSRRSDDTDDSLNKNNKRRKPHPGVTIPVTPAFSTRTRSRRVSHLSRDEMEQKEFEEEQKKKFKANPVNKKIFEAPTGYHVERKQSTVPEPFNITKTKKEEAAPLGANFKEMCNKLGCSAASIASLPWGGVPSKWEKSSTKLQPFSFDSRDKEKLQRKQETIQKVIEDEKKLAEFHAHPMPIFEDGIRGVPVKKPPTPTRSRPFNLRIDQRGEYKKEQFQRTLEEEEKLDKERRSFKATSDAVVHKDPFIPEKSMKALTDISGFTLNTEMRAEARTEFELHQKQKEDELLAAKEEREARRAAEEAAEIARLRREAIHKANPVPNYKPLEIKPAPCPPTVPISPKLVTKSRLRSRLNSRAESTNSTMDLSSATFTTD